MEKKKDKRLVKRTDVVDHLIKAGYGMSLTNLKQDERCKKCIESGEWKCDVCKQFFGIHHHGFKDGDEIDDFIEEYFRRRELRKEDKDV